MTRLVKLDNISIGSGCPLLLIAGPCVIEDYSTTYDIASYLKKLTDRLSLQFVFKASYDKANRTSVDSFRGPGLTKGLEILSQIKKELDIKILSDIHQIDQIEPAADVLDILQIPAFLCRQTDLIMAAAKTQKPINIKKGQFLAPWDIKNVVKKVTATGNHQVFITERGAMFGYNNLVVDFRSIQIIREMGIPVIFDTTHSIQLPGGAGTSSGGQRAYAPALARAAVASDADGIFMEVHKDPDSALCDGPNSLKLDDLETLLSQLIAIKTVLDPKQHENYTKTK